MNRTTFAGALIFALTLLASGSKAASAAPLSLLIPQGTAFTILGHSCGGIQEQAFATGFDSATGNPKGDVYIQTRCGGSGRGGGYHTTTYSAWVEVTWDFAGAVLSTTKLAAAPSVSATFSATDANGDQLTNSLSAVNVAPSACTVQNTTYCSYRAYLTGLPPGAPIDVTAIQVGDHLQVSWTPGVANPAVITSSTIAAAPVNSTATVTATIVGSATTGLVGPVQPVTTYQIVVVSTDAGGSSPPSNPISITTQAASIVPAAPTGVKAHWAAPGSPNDQLVATWVAAVPGDSPVDQYQITIRGSDGGGTFTQTVSGSTLSAAFSVSDIPDWSVKVQAHNAAGWGPWSTTYRLGGE